jgi:peptidase E
MASKRGVIALMGSGELTATMVDVHKHLLAGLSSSPRAVFLDTPAGFQLNVDQLSQRAVTYFSKHVQCPMSVASFKSSETTTTYEAEQAFQTLREADYVLIGPGSPTYAVRQWGQSPIPDILTRRVDQGACLVAASAAALTVGCFTLPVYEIYKVGEELHWAEGMNILKHFGFNLVVIPHWNNAEGGTHDTRFCYMGEPRFRKLESQLSENVGIFGLDEHTACLIDLEKQEAVIRGIGCVTLRYRGKERVFEKGDRFSVDLLRGKDVQKQKELTPLEDVRPEPPSQRKDASFWDRVHAIEGAFRTGLEKNDPKETTNALLELDRGIWEAQQDLENEEFISQARDLLRELIVVLGMRLESSPRDKTTSLAPLVEEMLRLREEFRQRKQWKAADAIRQILLRAEIVVEDTGGGSRWRIQS